ncbi:hypothetical protein LQ759_00925 [Serratia marcescens]|uniref:hypothetical protein n=1 Tax=Serratia marcescens TaxID=615 RepID=UPI001F16BAE9|nr:hypothetical protein [Serratia marcescens]MCF1608441.1 hypothetical protein [Serratia marcescens]BEL89737.1 hypothetical protein SM14BL03_16450 [Serratia marcescens]CAI1673400.1 Uncharacterised protein [Serratia marcescens]
MKCSFHIATGVDGFIADAGGGIPLFGAVGPEQRRLAVTPSDNGFAQARYAVQRES